MTNNPDDPGNANLPDTPSEALTTEALATETAAQRERDLVELARLVARYPAEAWLQAAGEPPRITVEDLFKTAQDAGPVLNWAEILHNARRKDLVRFVGIVTGCIEHFRGSGRQFAALAAETGITNYLTTIRIARGSAHLQAADHLDEAIAQALDRLDLIDPGHHQERRGRGRGRGHDGSEATSGEDGER